MILNTVKNYYIKMKKHNYECTTKGNKRHIARINTKCMLNNFKVLKNIARVST